MIQKKFRRPEKNMGHDMTKLLSKYLHKTWTDVESWNIKENKKLKK